MEQGQEVPQCWLLGESHRRQGQGQSPECVTHHPMQDGARLPGFLEKVVQVSSGTSAIPATGGDKPLPAWWQVA